MVLFWFNLLASLNEIVVQGEAIVLLGLMQKALSLARMVHSRKRAALEGAQLGVSAGVFRSLGEGGVLVFGARAFSALEQLVPHMLGIVTGHLGLNKHYDIQNGHHEHDVVH